MAHEPLGAIARHRRYPVLLSAGVCWAMLTGCGTAAAPGEVPSRSDETYVQARQEALERKNVQRRPEPDENAVVGEVPADVMGRIQEHLARRVDAPADELAVRRAEARVWPDGAMGCPQPGLNYTSAPVDGYWIVLEHQGRDYDYRVSRSGLMVMCEAMAIPNPPAQ
jgi:hypothetical protein